MSARKLVGALLSATMVILIPTPCSFAQTPNKERAEAVRSNPWVMLDDVDEVQRSATSYRMRIFWQNRERSTTTAQEIVCPDRKHLTMSENGKSLVDWYQIGSTQYSKGREGWRKLPKPQQIKIAFVPVSGCPGGPDDFLGGGGFNFSTMISDLRKESAREAAEITKGSSTNVEGLPCEMWDIATRNLSNEPRSIELCIAPDNLPLRVVIVEPKGKTQVNYSDWNSKKIAIAPPMK